VVSDSASALPDFEQPPVTEVALAVQFQPLRGLRAIQMGLLAARFRPLGLDRTQEHAPLAPLAPEAPPGSLPSGPALRLEVEDAPPVPRCWFLNENETMLVQVQPDRFVHNWRRGATAEPYPRYQSLLPSFMEHFGVFQDFVEAEKLGELSPDACELTYVNSLPSGAGWDRPGELGKVLAGVSGQYADSFLTEPEEIRLAERHAIVDEGGAFRGRLHINVRPAWRLPAMKAELMIVLSARGRPADGSDVATAVREFFDLGHEWIVRGFASMTTPRMHRIWGRKDA
jgi:uncharacterized protein (TIGR04255 family)